MTFRAVKPKVVVAGIESWPLQKLLDRMREAGEWNCDNGWAAREACPPAWRGYCSALDSEYRRRGQPSRLF